MESQNLSETEVKLDELKASLTVTTCVSIVFFVISGIAGFTDNFVHALVLAGIGLLLASVAFLSILPKMSKLHIHQFKESIAPLKEAFLKDK